MGCSALMENKPARLGSDNVPFRNIEAVKWGGERGKFV